jgi:hypothetical protein
MLSRKAYDGVLGSFGILATLGLGLVGCNSSAGSQPSQVSAQPLQTAASATTPVSAAPSAPTTASAPAPAASPSASPSPSAIVSFQYDNTIPQNEIAQLQSDLQYLAGHDAPAADPKLMTVMGISQPTSAQLSAWLSARVHYIVAQDFDPTQDGTILQQNYSYQNPNVTPDVLNPSPLSLSDVDAEVVMLNVGGGIYAEGKFNSANGAPAPVLIGENIPGVGEVQVTSPRVGIVQIGEGLFANAADPASGTDGLMVNISHLSVLFHEAHHSDGNGKSLGFFHSTCPSGLYAGKAACDDNLNGPYLVGALVERALTESCQDCTTADKENLRLEYLDSFSRQLKSAPSADTENQIEVFKNEYDGCTTMQAESVNQPPECAQLAALLKELENPANFVPATVMDSTPEGMI